MRARWKRRGLLRLFWRLYLVSWQRRLRANCASRRSASGPARTAMGRFLSFTIYWVLRLARRRNLRASMLTSEKSSRMRCANIAPMCATAGFLRTPSLIMRRNPRKIARLFSSTAERPINLKTRRGAGHDPSRDAHAVRLQRLGQSSGDGSGIQANCRAVRSGDGLELRLRARHTCACLRRRVDLAGTLSGPIACVAPGYDAIQGRAELAGALGRTRIAAARFCAWPDSVRPRPSDGIQDAQIRRLQQSALAIDAASRQSRNLSPRTGHHAAAANWRAADSDGPHALLSRARHSGGRLVSGSIPTPWTPSERLRG